jgi:hypothetical protein
MGKYMQQMVSNGHTMLLLLAGNLPILPYLVPPVCKVHRELAEPQAQLEPRDKLVT